MDGKQWCTSAHAKARFDIKGPQLTKAATKAEGLRNVVIDRRRAQVGDGKKGIRYVYHFGSLQLLRDAIDREE